MSTKRFILSLVVCGALALLPIAAALAGLAWPAVAACAVASLAYDAWLWSLPP